MRNAGFGIQDTHLAYKENESLDSAIFQITQKSFVSIDGFRLCGYFSTYVPNSQLHKEDLNANFFGSDEISQAWDFGWVARRASGSRSSPTASAAQRR